MTATSARLPCRDCHAAVPTDATVCPSCGYGVGRHDHLRFAFGLVGTVLTLSVVFAPIGLPMLWGAHRQRRYAEGSVTTPAQTTLADQLARVGRQLLGLPVGLEPTGEFTRGGSGQRDP